MISLPNQKNLKFLFRNLNLNKSTYLLGLVLVLFFSTAILASVHHLQSRQETTSQAESIVCSSFSSSQECLAISGCEWQTNPLSCAGVSVDQCGSGKYADCNLKQVSTPCSEQDCEAGKTGCEWKTETLSCTDQDCRANRPGCSWNIKTAPCTPGNCSHAGCQQSTEPYQECKKVSYPKTNWCHFEDGSCPSQCDYSPGSCTGTAYCECGGSRNSMDQTECRYAGCSWHYCSGSSQASCPSGCNWNSPTCTGKYITYETKEVCETKTRNVCQGGQYEVSRSCQGEYTKRTGCTGSYNQHQVCEGQYFGQGFCTGTPVQANPTPTSEPDAPVTPSPPPGVCSYGEYACISYTDCVHCEKIGEGDYDWAYTTIDPSHPECPWPCGVSEPSATPLPTPSTPPTPTLTPTPPITGRETPISDAFITPPKTDITAPPPSRTPTPSASPTPTLTPTPPILTDRQQPVSDAFVTPPAGIDQPAPTRAQITYRILELDSSARDQTPGYFCYLGDCVFKDFDGTNTYITSNLKQNLVQNCPAACRPAAPAPTTAPQVALKPTTTQKSEEPLMVSEVQVTSNMTGFHPQSHLYSCTEAAFSNAMGVSEQELIQGYKEWLKTQPQSSLPMTNQYETYDPDTEITWYPQFTEFIETKYNKQVYWAPFNNTADPNANPLTTAQKGDPYKCGDAHTCNFISYENGIVTYYDPLQNKIISKHFQNGPQLQAIMKVN